MLPHGIVRLSRCLRDSLIPRGARDRLRRPARAVLACRTLKLRPHARFNKLKRHPAGCLFNLAEREGFEPAVRGYRTPDFESGTFNHSATSPDGLVTTTATPDLATAAAVAACAACWRVRYIQPLCQLPDGLATATAMPDLAAAAARAAGCQRPWAPGNGLKRGPPARSRRRWRAPDRLSRASGRS